MVGYTPYYVSGGVHLNTPRLLIASVPRSGSHGLEYVLATNLDVKVIRNHPGLDTFDENNVKIPAISIVRNPIDCISSWLSMTERAIGEQTEDDLKVFISNNSKAYEIGMNFAKRKATVIMKYESLSDKDLVIDFFKNKFSLQKISNLLSQEQYWQNGIRHEVESSKTHYRYDYIRSLLEKTDLSKINSLYLELFNKADL